MIGRTTQPGKPDLCRRFLSLNLRGIVFLPQPASICGKGEKKNKTAVVPSQKRKLWRSCSGEKTTGLKPSSDSKISLKVLYGGLCRYDGHKRASSSFNSHHLLVVNLTFRPPPSAFEVAGESRGLSLQGQGALKGDLSACGEQPWPGG